MSLAHSPKVVTNGLLFYTDMTNTSKSFRGAPTTNSVTNADVMTGWTNYYRTTASSTFMTEFGTIGYRFINQPSWNGIYRSVTIPATGTYTFSARFRYLGGSASNNGATVYISGWGGGDSAVGIDKSKIGVWQDISITLNCTNTTFTFYIISYGGTDNGTGNPDFSSWEVTMPQAESGSTARPFVNGTRSNTQAIIDIARKTTVTASNIVYNANNTFNFSYSSPSYLTVPLSTAFNKTEGTMNFWLYPTRYNGGNGYFVNREDASANATDWFWIGPYSNVFYFRIGNGSTCCDNDLTFSNVDTTIPVNTWTNMCFTWKINGTSVIYKNGAELVSRSIGNIPNTNPASNGRIGLGHANADDYFDGRMPVVQIYNRQLTAAEVRANFNAMRGRYGL
jgi:hypothetical protein